MKIELKLFPISNVTKSGFVNEIARVEDFDRAAANFFRCSVI